MDLPKTKYKCSTCGISSTNAKLKKTTENSYGMFCKKCLTKKDKAPTPLEIDRDSDLQPYSDKDLLKCCFCCGIFKIKKKSRVGVKKPSIIVDKKFLNKT